MIGATMKLMTVLTIAKYSRHKNLDFRFPDFKNLNCQNKYLILVYYSVLDKEERKF